MGDTWAVARWPPEGEKRGQEQRNKGHSSSQDNPERKWVGFLPEPGPRTEAETRDEAATFHRQQL